MKRILLLVLLFAFEQVLPQEEVTKEIIKGEYKGTIREKKPESELDYDMFEVPSFSGDPGTHIYDEELREHSEIASTPLPRLSSDQITRPWLNTIITPPIGIFHPLYGGDVKNWELVITDATGGIFQTISGEGRPPERITWNGKDGKGNMIDIGTDYSFYVKAVDKLNNTSRILGKKIRIPGLYWEEEPNSIIRLDGRIVFRDNSPELTEVGNKLLLESSDYVRRDIQKRLRVVVYSRKEELSLDRAKGVANFLLDRIIIPTSVITRAAGYESAGKDKTDRIDIIIR